MANKREGDGATPRGTLPAAAAVVAGRPPTAARRPVCPLRRIGPDDAWCEDPARPALQPPDPRRARRATADRLWRDDHLYDLIIELDYNTRPRIAGRGSAVFLHVARPGFAPTAGCVALRAAAAARLLLARLRAADTHRRRMTQSDSCRRAQRARRRSRCRPAHAWRRSAIARLEIGAHAHREQLQPVALGDLGEQREMRRRRLLGRRDAHQALDRQAVLARGRRRGRRRPRPADHAGLLRLLAGIDLDEQARRPALLRDLLGERLGERRPVEGMDRRRTAPPPPWPCWIAAGRSGAARRPG